MIVGVMIVHRPEQTVDLHNSGVAVAVAVAGMNHLDLGLVAVAPSVARYILEGCALGFHSAVELEEDTPVRGHWSVALAASTD